MKSASVRVISSELEHHLNITPIPCFFLSHDYFLQSLLYNFSFSSAGTSTLDGWTQLSLQLKCLKAAILSLYFPESCPWMVRHMNSFSGFFGGFLLAHVDHACVLFHSEPTC
jgi:hypothetical protein